MFDEPNDEASFLKAMDTMELGLAFDDPEGEFDSTDEYEEWKEEQAPTDEWAVRW
tara:strand:- start:166 stop:330 length:165 start_codon:yes stop_codon:yes gene_type:complete